MINSWKKFGERVAEARKAAGVTQKDLATSIGLDRTAVSKIESGTRHIDSLELAKIGDVLRRPVSWFMTSPSPMVVSRREAREGMEQSADVLLESLATDVEQLVEMKLLTPAPSPPLNVSVDDVETAEQAALAVRSHLALPTQPLNDVVRIAEQLGLYVFVLELKEKVQGSYLALTRGGVALVQGTAPSGKRRFTAIHELGHHVLADEYSTEWIKGGKDERERLISAFAVHLLLPRASARTRWEELDGDADPWNAAVHLGAEFGLSWSALCAQLKNLDLVSEQDRNELSRRPPGAIDFLERMLTLVDMPKCPSIPPGYCSAVIKAFRGHRIGKQRALELLLGTVEPRDLPEQHEVPMNAMLDELSPL